MRICIIRILFALSALSCFSYAKANRLVINEVFYNVSPQGGNQYVELFNAGTNTAYLDGKILTDNAAAGTEGVFKFPGSPGGTTLPVSPGAFVVIAVDATNATAGANWECYAGVTDTDNPSVPNLTLIAGSADLGLFTGGDNVILADGTSTNLPINTATILDGVNFAGGGGDLAHIGPGIPEVNPNATAPSGFSIGRCPNGADNDISSFAEFFAMILTPGSSNNCTQPSLSISSISIAEGNSGTVTAQVPVTLSPTGALPVTVQFFTSNGTALAGSDYVATNGVLTFAPGVLTQFVRVAIVGDVIAEANEQFTVRLQNPTNATLASAIATLTIIDDDGAPPVVTSVFVSVSGFPPALTTRWESVSGSVYRLEASPALISPAWTNVGSIVTAVSATTTLVDTNAAVTTRFYRVLELLP